VFNSLNGSALAYRPIRRRACFIITDYEACWYAEAGPRRWRTVFFCVKDFEVFSAIVWNSLLSESCHRLLQRFPNTQRLTCFPAWQLFILRCTNRHFIITYADCSREFSRPFVCFMNDIPNMIDRCSTMSPRNRFILGSKGQRLRSPVTRILPASIIALLWVLVSSSYHCKLVSNLWTFRASHLL